MKYFFGHFENSAVGYYRIIQPAIYLSKLKGVEIMTFPFDTKSPTLKIHSDEVVQISQWADKFVFGRVDNVNLLAMIQTIKKVFNKPIFAECDDFVDRIPVENPAYNSYNPSTNLAQIAHEQFKLSDGLIVSTQPLADVYGKYNKNVHVVPNAVDFSIVNEFYKPSSSKGNKVVIGWSGGSAHKLDLEIIKKPLIAFLKDNPHVQFQVMGMQLDWAKEIPNFKHIPWVAMDEFYKKYYSLGWDIGLAPLFDSEFNRCKSNLRYLELSAQKIPTIASPVYPYANSIKNGKTGFLAKTDKEWYDHLQALVDNISLRKTIGHAAYKYVKENFSAPIVAKKYLSILK